MCAKLWDKGKKESDPSLAARVEAFTVGDDPTIDAHILADDCWASIAHAAALSRAGILTPSERDRLQAELLSLIERHATEGVPIARSQEDCHTAIEEALTERLGDLGKKVHTGRSRNDQVLTALRLYTRRRLLDVTKVLRSLAAGLLTRAAAGTRIPMRGYTHTQPAMPTTLAVFLGAHASALLDDGLLLRTAYELNDQCPLGSAAGFGSVIALDRPYTARLLGFSRVQVNALYCQNSRGKIEGTTLHALAAIQESLASLAGDLILFSTREFGFVTLPDALTTGSSIMPQKRNPDVLELVRGRAGVVAAACEQARVVASRLPSGYNRDYQLLKGPLVTAFTAVEESLVIMTSLVEAMTFDTEALKASCTREIYAADMALEKAQAGIPFRDAYKQAMDELASLTIDADFVTTRMDAYKTLGSMGDPGIPLLKDDLDELGLWLAARRKGLVDTYEALGKPLTNEDP